MAVKCTLLFWGIHCVLSHFSHVWLFATLCTVALQTALSMGFSSILQNTGVGCHALLQGIFPTQRSNPSLPHCRRIFLPSEPPGKPKNTGVGSLSLLQGIFPTQELNQGLLHCRQILYQLSYQGSPPCRRDHAKCHTKNEGSGPTRICSQL